MQNLAGDVNPLISVVVQLRLPFQHATQIPGVFVWVMGVIKAAPRLLAWFSYALTHKAHPAFSVRIPCVIL